MRVEQTSPIRFRIGTRGSKLALQQTEQVRCALRARFPQAEIQIHIIHTKGDRILDKGLSQIGDKGLFTSELEQALMNREIDLAVHSMKDVPGDLPENFALAAVLPREFPADVLISHRADSIQGLPPGAVIGTSSLRRIAQLKYLRPDVRIVQLRGNVETRLRKMEEEQLDGILLAWAGMKRLGLEEKITQVIPFEEMLPAVGQGAIGVEMASDSALFPLLQQLDDSVTHQCVAAERAFLRRLEGGCQVPLAALARYEDGKLTLHGRVIHLEGKKQFSCQLAGRPEEAENLGVQAAEILLRQGAREILEDIRVRTGGLA